MARAVGDPRLGLPVRQSECDEGSSKAVRSEPAAIRGSLDELGPPFHNLRLLKIVADTVGHVLGLKHTPMLFGEHEFDWLGIGAIEFLVPFERTTHPRVEHPRPRLVRLIRIEPDGAVLQVEVAPTKRGSFAHATPLAV
jgi:hypothetical protein